MTQITSTHRHDFRWPTADCLVPRAEAPNGRCVPPPPTSGPDRNKPWCGRVKPQAPAPGPLEALPRACYDLAPEQGDSPQPWCQRGPLVNRFNTRTASAPPQVRSAPAGCEAKPSARPWCEGDAPPRTLAAKVGAAPQQDTSRYDQPNQYLRRLCDKFPEPVSIVTAKPRDELMRRVYADRYRTTYQADYCRNSDDIARTIGECDSYVVNQYKPGTWDGQGPTSGDGYSHDMLGASPQFETCGGGGGGGSGSEPRIRPLACRPAAVSKNFHFSCCTLKKSDRQSADHVGPPEKIPPWVSEYNDSIGKTAQMIMEHKLLYPKKEKKHKL